MDAKLSKDDLLARAAQLSRDELAGALSFVGSTLSDAAAVAKPAKKKRPQHNPFDMSRYAQRHVAFRVAYIGTDYHGLAWSADTPMTIEVCTARREGRRRDDFSLRPIHHRGSSSRLSKRRA